MTRDEKIEAAISEAHRRRSTPVPVRPLQVVPSRATIPPVLPCPHRGGPTGEEVTCTPCGGKIQLKVFGCGVHKEGCTLTKPVPGKSCCKGCNDNPNGSAPTPSGPHPNIALSYQFAASIPAYPEGTYSGRGIVICGGGRYWPSAYVTLRMIRAVGCTLPVQVWYLGHLEHDPRYIGLLKQYGAEVVDASAHPAVNRYRNVIGFPGSPPFQVKSYAVLHSPFEEVLCLDADSYPCADPSGLFNEPRYRISGAVFWPDLPGTNPWTKWRDWGVQKFGPDCGWEVGQYLVNKRVAWRQLNLTRWYDDHGDWCYGGQHHHDHGDKGTHRVSWALYRTEPTFYSIKSVWKSIAFVHPGPDGHDPMFIHRCRSKFVVEPTPFKNTPQNGTNLWGGLPGEGQAFKFLTDLKKELS